MKLRILENKLRFRLSQSEVKDLENGSEVLATTDFPDGSSLSYSIRPVADINDAEASYADNVILMKLPSNGLTGWHADNREGFYFKLNLEGDQLMEIAIEKDFQCLHKRPGEEDIDSYPNPLQTHE